ncbi:MAG: GNAT family N-acetyltransferase [Chloroflexi bacterium]|nr:GNAT family N-acetyltransferase [Chloroflexota bacterium]MCH7953813.1 GNAT family N-acetyltransferase [Chloroflexota bacterium]MCI0814470.1 GNAT family N-acetyltransferase [Chloroflexota bacterium]MCI0816682.1 GNAT family N-acetyltransferase [Chloroflexota bacterium]MCI0831835.1 GNAT family N-acetyltransferase [Chloroflexota bacterium]
MTIVPPLLRLARPEDVDAVTRLMASESLPAVEVDEWLSSFWVLDDAGTLVGCAGIERYGDAALLRSVVVAEALRGSGEGVRMTERALTFARDDGARRCYLFTMTAPQFFSRFGFERCRLDDFEPAVRRSWQWQAISGNEALAEQVIPMRADL